jgi:CO dehydrogenase maturation factor
LKISICGKGGSGKSTVVTLLAEELSGRGWRVVVVDSDESNSGLHRLLGFDQPPRPLLELVGGKQNVRRELRTKSGRGEDGAGLSVLARPEVRVADLPAEHFAERDRTRLVTVGKIHQALEGCACPMGVLAREFLKKLRTADDEIVVVDMEAGIEHFGRGIETSIDAVVVVVEASFESLELAGKVRQLASDASANFVGAVVNKVGSQELASRLARELEAREIAVVGTIYHHEEIAAAGLAGEAPSSGAAQQEAAAIVDALLARGSTGR